MSGQASARANITAISLASKCEITTLEEDVYSTGDRVTITDLGQQMPVPRGMPQINNYTYLVEKTSSTTYLIKDIITLDYIDSTNFTPYVEGGNLNIDQTTFIYEA